MRRDQAGMVVGCDGATVRPHQLVLFAVALLAVTNPVMP